MFTTEAKAKAWADKTLAKAPNFPYKSYEQAHEAGFANVEELLVDPI